jgi:ABC-type transport system involved in multi-copper enzyme maturation permease subunit
MRLGLGPVFLLECVTSARRWQNYALRAGGVAALLVAMLTITPKSNATDAKPSWRDYAALGERYFYAMVGVELALFMLAAPAATAGAICLDRSNGTLAHVLATDLSDSEIVLGKLGARLVPVLGLVACTWPVLSISSLLGGIDPIALTLAILIIPAVAVLGCALALALSVWARRPHEVILAVYMAWAALLLSYPMWLGVSRGGRMPAPPRALLLADPFYLAFAPYNVPGQVGLGTYAVFFIAVLGLAAAMILLAVWRMRPVTVGRAGEGDRASRPGFLGRLVRALPEPSLERFPVLWREWRRARPSRWMLWLGGFLAVTTTALCVASAVAFWTVGYGWGLGRQASPWIWPGVYAYMIQILFGFLMLAACAPLALAEERQSGSLDVLCSTPLATRTIVAGKWWGCVRLVPLLALGPGLVALAMATYRHQPPPQIPGVAPTATRPSYGLGEELEPASLYFGVGVMVLMVLAYGAVFTSLGLCIATWIKRPGRAVAFSVSAFVAIAIVWPFVVFPFFGDNSSAEPVAAASPVFLAGSLSDALMMRHERSRPILWAGFAWSLCAVGVAYMLLELAVRSFDSCIGRMPETGARRPIPPRSRRATSCTAPRSAAGRLGEPARTT